MVTSLVLVSGDDIYVSSSLACTSRYLFYGTTRTFFKSGFLWRLGIKESSLRKPENLNLSIKPNPIRNWAVVNFFLKEHNYVTLKLYNPMGQVVKNILEGNKISGEYNIKIDTKGLASGTYFLVLKIGSEIISKRLIIIK